MTEVGRRSGRNQGQPEFAYSASWERKTGRGVAWRRSFNNRPHDDTWNVQSLVTLLTNRKRQGSPPTSRRARNLRIGLSSADFEYNMRITHGKMINAHIVLEIPLTTRFVDCVRRLEVGGEPCLFLFVSNVTSDWRSMCRR